MRSRFLIQGVLILLLVVLGVGWLIKMWPFTRQAVIHALQESSSKTVTIDRFVRTYFPPGCVAEGIRFRDREQSSKPPLIMIQKLTIEGSYTRLLRSPKRLKEVRVIGMHVTIPPRNPQGGSPPMPLTAVKSRRPILVETVLADNILLEFLSSKPGKQAYKLLISKLNLANVSNNQPIRYTASIENTEPPGDIQATGQFGPWEAQEPGRTDVSGTYSYTHADLGVFKGLAGKMSSQGQFSGTLDHINVSGHNDIPDFHVAHSRHTEHLTSDFKAVVNATDGDTFLEEVRSRFGKTTLLSTGSIAGRPGEKGKVVLLEVTSAGGRVEDLLNLFITAKQSPMTGNFALKARVTLPPAHEPFLQKLKLEGDFGLAAGKFTSHDTQEMVDKLSTSARRRATEEEKENPETALSNLQGHISARDGITTFTNVAFRIPGANAKVNGTYNLLTQRVDLHGVLSTGGKLYVTQKGFHSLLLRAISPFLKHREHLTIVPFKVTGIYPDAVIALDVFGKS